MLYLLPNVTHGQIIDITDKKHQKLFAAIDCKKKMEYTWQIVFKKVFGTNIDELGYDGSVDITFSKDVLDVFNDGI